MSIGRRLKNPLDRVLDNAAVLRLGAAQRFHRLFARGQRLRRSVVPREMAILLGDRGLFVKVHKAASVRQRRENHENRWIENIRSRIGARRRRQCSDRGAQDSQSRLSSGHPDDRRPHPPRDRTKRHF